MMPLAGCLPMDATLAMPILTECPRCGGYARRMDDVRSMRWRCRGCRATFR